MPRVLVLNNYSLERVWGEVRRGEKPDHHLFGLNYFHERGYDVQLVPFDQSPFWLKLDRLAAKARLLPFLGCLDQQSSAWRGLNECDLIYSPCQTQTHLLSYLRAVGLVRVPIVCLAHHPLVGGRLSQLRTLAWKLSIKGTDAFPSLSRKVMEEINELAANPTKSQVLSWGPDLTYYPSAPGPGDGVVSAGRTARDFEVLGLAASRTKSKTLIICPQSLVPPSAARFGSHVRIDVQPQSESMNYLQLCRLFGEARVMAIPLLEGTALAGLTSLLDALGMGKPVIMTRHPLIDIDIEAEGVGRWVDYGDIEGWTKSIEWFEDNKTEAAEMGTRARQLVEGGFNSRTFAHQVMDIFDSVLVGSSAT
jgi:glycosyltransferase involved in cell wall biosynthesis